MEILVDILDELHSLLWTRLPQKWDVVDLKPNRNISVILNDITYFMVYTAFLVWFGKILISRIENAIGRRLEAKDKCVICVVSMASAMHIFWPALLFFAHFLACNFYPWVTAVVVLLLNIFTISPSLRKICSVICSRVLNCSDYIKRMLSFEWMMIFRVFRSTRELVSSPDISDGRTSEGKVVGPSSRPVIQPKLKVDEEHRPPEGKVVGHSSRPVIEPRFIMDEEYRTPEENAVRPSARPVIQPRLKMDEEYRTPEGNVISPSSRPVIQPRLKMNEEHRPSEEPGIQSRVEPDGYIGPSKAPVKQPRKAAEEAHRSFKVPGTKPGIETDEYIGPSQTPLIQPRKAVKERYKPSEAPVIQPKIASEENMGPSQTPVIQPRKAVEDIYRPSKTPKIQPQSISENPYEQFETPIKQHRVDFTPLREAHTRQPRLDHTCSYRESETPRQNYQVQSRQPYRALDAPKMEPRFLSFETTDICPQGEFSDYSGASTLKSSTEYSMNSELETETNGKNERKEAESKNVGSQLIDDQIEYEDFSQQLDWDKKGNKTSTPRKKRSKR